MTNYYSPPTFSIDPQDPIVKFFPQITLSVDMEERSLTLDKTAILQDLSDKARYIEWSTGEEIGIQWRDQGSTGRPCWGPQISLHYMTAAYSEGDPGFHPFTLTIHNTQTPLSGLILLSLGLRFASLVYTDRRMPEVEIVRDRGVIVRAKIPLTEVQEEQRYEINREAKEKLEDFAHGHITIDHNKDLGVRQIEVASYVGRSARRKISKLRNINGSLVSTNIRSLEHVAALCSIGLNYESARYLRAMRKNQEP